MSIDLELASKLSDTALLREFTGLNIKPTESVFRVSGTDQLVHLRGTTRVGSTQIESRLEIAVDETGISDIKGSVTTPSLLTSDFGLDKILSPEQLASTERAATESDSSTGKRIPRHMLPDFSFDTILVAGKVTGPSINATNLVAHLTHDGAHSQLKNFSVRLPGGLVRATVSLDQSGHEPLWQLDGVIKEFRIEYLMGALGSELEVSGGVNSLFSLASAGHTGEELLDDVDGEAAIALEQVRLKGAAYDQMATDTLAWFFTGGVLQDETHFGCVLGEFKLSDGIVHGESLFAESDHLIADGKARIDLHSNEIDLAIIPRSKRRAFQIPGTIRITGTLDDPKISTSAIATGADTAAQVVMIAPSIALRAFDTTLSLLGIAPKEPEQALSPCQQAQQKI